ncbi:aldose epimerase family protein [Lachnobacterium bovis]|uniref:aldose epimerase family protein n=1 Tax=Lachnobacterium bovis TaxID=140626 RepID=UPI0003B2F8E4|nr:aldose epimerase family protein [Lachnobacterium bovis]
MEQVSFGKTKDGQEVTNYFISNCNGMKVGVTNYGATITSIKLHDKDGIERDVVLGYDDVLGYQNGTCYFGATVGRNCNRIADAKIELDGVVYELEKNDNENNLHSASHGVDKKIWDVLSVEENKIVFNCLSKDLEQDFPGNMQAQVTFEVSDENELSIKYHAVSDKKTVMNFTNHSYFNLGGHDSGDVLNHILQVNASHYTPVIDSKSIPTGEIASIEDTPFDFRKAKEIGKNIFDDNDQLKYGNGYDHNLALDKKGEEVELIATCYCEKTGLKMDVLTDLPGVQLYTANFVDGEKGKNNAVYNKRSAVCLETQYYPNSVNENNFKKPIFDAGESYDSTTIYRFSVK